MKSRNMKIAIIGGGLAGISAARHAQKAGLDYEIFEASDRLGGRVQSISYKGFILDRGFQVVNLRYPELRKLMRKNPPATKIFSTLVSSSGHDFSLFNIRNLFTRSSGSFSEKLSFLIYVLKRPAQPLARASKKFPTLYKKLIRPFLSGVFLNDPEAVDLHIVHSIVRHFLRGRPSLITGGLTNLVIALTAPLNTSKIHLNSAVTQVEKTESGYRIFVNGNNAGKFDRIVVATNGHPGEISGIAIGNNKRWLSSITVYHSTSRPNLPKKLFLGGSFVNSLAISEANDSYG